MARAGTPLPINVSPLQFRKPDFVARVCAILLDTGPADQLIFEATEGSLVVAAGIESGEQGRFVAAHGRPHMQD